MNKFRAIMHIIFATHWYVVISETPPMKKRLTISKSKHIDVVETAGIKMASSFVDMNGHETE